MSIISSRRLIVSRLLLLASATTTPLAIAATETLTPTHDTFINSASPDNNNGASTSIFTGKEGRGGAMRGLVRFAMPAGLSGRVIVNDAALTMTRQALGNGAPGAAATLSLHPLAVGWVEGAGAGTNTTTFVVGQACTGIEPSWNRPECTTGTWPAVGAASGSLAVDSAFGPVTWTSAGLIADVQSWIDVPAGNNGWLVVSSTEAIPGSARAQRFHSSEASSSPASLPSLLITYACKSGLLESGSLCTTCTTAATSACAVSQGNSCVDSGPPSVNYSCSCSAPGYSVGTVGGNPACVTGGAPQRVLDIDGNGSYDALTDGLLIVRYMLGLRGAILIDKVVGSTPQRPTFDAIETYLAGIKPSLDVDQNGEVDGLTDGIVILRALFGLRGQPMSAGVTGTSAQRTQQQIEEYVLSLMP